jgi:hypothetical protein
VERTTFDSPWHPTRVRDGHHREASVAKTEYERVQAERALQEQKQIIDAIIRLVEARERDYRRPPSPEAKAVIGGLRLTNRAEGFEQSLESRTAIHRYQQLKRIGR